MFSYQSSLPFPVPAQVFYLEDVFASGQRELNAQLCQSLMERFVRPLLLGDWLSGKAGSTFPQVRAFSDAVYNS